MRRRPLSRFGERMGLLHCIDVRSAGVATVMQGTNMQLQDVFRPICALLVWDAPCKTLEILFYHCTSRQLVRRTFRSTACSSLSIGDTARARGRREGTRSVLRDVQRRRRDCVRVCGKVLAKYMVQCRMLAQLQCGGSNV